jgi:hypothetical protein
MAGFLFARDFEADRPRKSAGFACFAQDGQTYLMFYGRKTRF